jgi:addiction module HigA family antidote
MAASGKFPPVHPGETLLEDFMKPLRLSINRLAIELRVPATRMYEVVRGQRTISPDTALRLARYFGTSPEFWLNLQQHYDLERARDELERRVDREVQPRRDPDKRAF